MNICVLGASITWGAYDSEAAGWANRLRMYLESKYDDIDVYNLGVCGDSTGDLLKRADNELAARKPGMIIYGIGTNDSRFIHSQNKQQTSPEEYEQNIAKLASIARNYTEKIVFVGLTPVNEEKTNPVSWNKDKSYLNKIINELNNVLESFCKQNNIIYVSVDGLILESDLYEDGLHPNASGHKKIFEKIKKEIEFK